MILGSAEWKNLIRDGSKTIGIAVDQEQSDLFALHALELSKWNRKINLTAITDPAEVAVKHFLDSIAAASMIPLNASLLDIGSGGGFPGIPLKVVVPSLSVTLIDSSRKKVSFQQHVIRSLSLGDIEARHVRAEEIAKSPEFANAFDVVICRALASLDEFVRMALPLLAECGMLIALKGKVTDAEIESVLSRTFQVSGTSNPLEVTSKDYFSLTVKKYALPFLGSERAIVSLTRRGTYVKSVLPLFSQSP